MSSMSFIAQSQIQRSQSVQSPTNSILQAGSDCSCNHSNLSMIAQSQKTGCGCNEGTNPYDNSNEDSNPPVPAMHSGDDCIWVFSHIETEVVPDTPLQDNPDIIKLIYKRDCSKRRDGGTDPGGRGGGPIGGGPGTVLGKIDIFNNSGYQEPKVCLTCEIINSVYDELLKEVKTGKGGIFYDIIGKAYNALFEFMSDAMKNIRERVYSGDSLGLDNQYGEEDDIFFQDYFDLFNKLEVTGSKTPENNIYMKYYLLEMLEKLKECPKQLVVKLNRKMNNNIFEFVNLNDIPNEYIDKYGDESHEFVEEKNGNLRIAYGSVYSIGQNTQDPCAGGYSFYKWTPHLGGESGWGRINNRYFF